MRRSFFLGLRCSAYERSALTNKTVNQHIIVMDLDAGLWRPSLRYPLATESFLLSVAMMIWQVRHTPMGCSA